MQTFNLTNKDKVVDRGDHASNQRGQSAMAFDICMRFVFGVVCDKYGPLISQGNHLLLAALGTNSEVVPTNLDSFFYFSTYILVRYHSWLI